MAAAWTKTDVLAVAPELNTPTPILDGTFSYFIAIAARQVSPDAFGERIVEAGAYLTAHLMIRAGYGLNGAGAGGAGMAAGAVSGISVGKVSVNFATLIHPGMTADEMELMTTRPGSQFLTHVRLCVGAPIVIGSDIPSFL